MRKPAAFSILLAASALAATAAAALTIVPSDSAAVLSNVMARFSNTGAILDHSSENDRRRRRQVSKIASTMKPNSWARA